MKDHQKKTEVNDLISLVESDAWKEAHSLIKLEMVHELYDRLKASKRFVPPTENQVELFMVLELEHWPSSPSVNFYSENEARKFVYFYASKDWMVGKNKMKDWRAAARGWMARNKPPKAQPENNRPTPPKSDDSRLF